MNIKKCIRYAKIGALFGLTIAAVFLTVGWAVECLMPGVVPGELMLTAKAAVITVVGGAVVGVLLSLITDSIDQGEF